MISEGGLLPPPPGPRPAEVFQMPTSQSLVVSFDMDKSKKGRRKICKGPSKQSEKIMMKCLGQKRDSRYEADV